MDHWFDRLTKNVTSNGITRRTFLDGALAGVALAVLDWRFDPVLAAQAPASSGSVASTKVRFIPGLHPTATTIQEKTQSFGPCTVTTNEGHYARHFKSESQVSGHTVSVKRAHTADKDQPVLLETKFEVDGKPQLTSSVSVIKNSKEYRLQIGEAFGFTALLMSDDGKTVRGTINGRAVIPFTKKTTGQVKFEDGKPFKAQPEPYLQDAIKTAFARANEDLKMCAAPTHAFDARRSDAMRVTLARHLSGTAPFEVADSPPCYDCDHALPLTTDLGYSNAVFSIGCQACLDNCNNQLNNCLTDNGFGAILSFGLNVKSDIALATGCNSNDVSCITACSAGPCLGDLCPDELKSLQQTIAAGGSIAAPVPSCARNEVCVSSLGYCCPKAYPTVCPGSFDPYSVNTTTGSNLCCQLGYSCMYDNTHGGYACCPKASVCTGGPVRYPWSIKGGGVCCGPGEICNKGYGACCPRGEVPDGHGGCCPPYQIRGGACCGGTDPITKQWRMWCGGQCVVCPRGRA